MYMENKTWNDGVTLPNTTGDSWLLAELSYALGSSSHCSITLTEGNDSILPCRGYLAVSGNIFGCHNLSVLPITSWYS